MAIIKSGASSDQLTIDPTAKGARVLLYDAQGNAICQKVTYRAATTAVLVPAVTVNIPWFVMQGSGTKTIRVQRIQLSGLTLTGVAYMHVNLAKYSTNASGGTSTTLPAIPMDSVSAAGTSAGVKVYTAVPTAGNKVGDISSKRFMGQATTAAASGITDFVDFDFRNMGEASALVLRGTTQEIGIYWQTAPATTPSLLMEVEWTEE